MKRKELTKIFMMISNYKKKTFVSRIGLYTNIFKLFYPLTAKLFNLNFHPLEVVSR